jgi:hypothetical protein
VTLFDINISIFSGFILWAAFCIILFLVGLRYKIEEAFRAGHDAGLSYGCGCEYSGDADYSYGQWTMRGM